MKNTRSKVRQRAPEEKQELYSNSMAIDSGYSWLVCGAAFCTLFITLGLHYSCGVIFVALLDHFGENKAKTGMLMIVVIETFIHMSVCLLGKVLGERVKNSLSIAWVQSISQFMIFFFSSLSSFLTERYGARPVTMTGGMLMSVGLLASSFVNRLDLLYLTYGIIFGFGTALAYLPTLVMVGQYFEKRRSLATGIATCGSNIGALSLAIIQEVILKRHGWRNVFRFTGCFSMLVILCGVIFRPLIKLPMRERPRWTFKKKAVMLMNNRKFSMWCAATTIGCFGYFIPHVHLIRYAEDNKITARNATLLITFMSAGSGVGKLIYGRVCDYFERHIPAIYVTSMFLSGVSSISFSFISTSYLGLVTYAVVLGFLDGSYIGIMSIMTFKCAGSAEMMSQSWGISLMFMSLSMLVGPPTVGWLKQYDVSYRCLFYLAGGPMIVGALILAPAIWMKSETLDMFGENSVVLMNEQNPETNNSKHFEEQRLTVV